MDELKLHKYKVEKEIVDKAIIEYEEARLSEEELKNIADYVVLGMKNVNSTLELIKFLNEFSSKWPIFKNIAIIEEGMYKEEMKDEVYSGALTLAQHGKLDSAIKLARTITN